MSRLTAVGAVAALQMVSRSTKAVGAHFFKTLRGGKKVRVELTLPIMTTSESDISKVFNVQIVLLNLQICLLKLTAATRWSFHFYRLADLALHYHLNVIGGFQELEVLFINH